MTAKFNLSNIVEPLLDWYDAYARVLPWRKNTDPYRVWISEIMLQQTRVEAVKPYYERFLTELPDIHALAEAEEEKLLKLWEGLGYYSRVRNLQKAAVVICEKYGGSFPAQHKDILSLPGIGPYTAGAIASISFGLPEPAVDGNVLRVLARLREDSADINDAKRKKQVTEELRAIYPADRSGDFTQSLMELGAVVCLPNGTPLCGQCPLREICQSRLHESQTDFPVKSSRKARKKEKKTVLLLCRDHQIAIEKRPSKGLLADLWQFPLIDGTLTEEEILQWLSEQGYHAAAVKFVGSRKHIFTHIEWEMHGYLVEITASQISQSPENSHQPPQPFIWVTEDELEDSYSLPSAFQPFFRYLKEHSRFRSN